MSPEDRPQAFYDELAESYHLLFADWDRSIARQAATLRGLLAATGASLRILDCACGIGTQALGLAALGHAVLATDLSPAAVARARCEASLRDLPMECRVSDMRSLAEVPERSFDVVVALDNALPHLTPGELPEALRTIRARLRPDGQFLASIRDYERAIEIHPSTQPASFFGEPGRERIVHQVWEWYGDRPEDRTYRLHLFLTEQDGPSWRTRHFLGTYHALLQEELTAALQQAGFADIVWLPPERSGYYQPVVSARRRS